MAKQGELTADTVVKALTGQAEVIAAEFDKTDATVRQGFTVLVNSATEAVGKLNDVTGAGGALGGFLEDLGTGLREFAEAVRLRS